MKVRKTDDYKGISLANFPPSTKISRWVLRLDGSIIDHCRSDAELGSKSSNSESFLDRVKDNVWHASTEVVYIGPGRPRRVRYR